MEAHKIYDLTGTILMDASQWVNKHHHKYLDMQTFKNNSDAFLKEWPKSLVDWQAVEPVIKFTVSGSRIVHPGDRIHAATKMRNGGENSGSVFDVYYIIEKIVEVKKNALLFTDVDVTATAKRIEI